MHSNPLEGVNIMKRLPTTLLILLISILLLGSVACGSAGSNPATPSLSGNSAPVVDTEGTGVLGVWDVTFDPDSMTIDALESRDAAQHFNITGLVQPTMTFGVVSYNPAAGILIFNAFITNPSNLAVYDVRTLFLSGPGLGYQLQNPDDYTALFNPYGPGIVNPFKAYAKTAISRQFGPGLTYQEQFQVQIPIGSAPPFSFQLLVECSWPANCDDVYEISNQTVSNIVDNMTSAIISLDGFDHQGNISGIYVDTTPITGGFTNLVISSTTTWKGTVINSAGAPAATYSCMIVANSAGTPDALYDFVNIVVGNSSMPAPPPPPPPPVNTPPPTSPTPIQPPTGTPPPPPGPPPPPPPVPPPTPPPVPPPVPPIPPPPPPNPPPPPPIPPPIPPPPPPAPPPPPPTPNPPPNPGG